jgi:hypothetical protein
VTAAQLSFDDAKNEAENLYLAWVGSMDTGRNRRLDAKNALLAYVNEWSSGFPTRRKKMHAFLNMLLAETFGEAADDAADDLGV